MEAKTARANEHGAQVKRLQETPPLFTVLKLSRSKLHAILALRYLVKTPRLAVLPPWHPSPPQIGWQVAALETKVVPIQFSVWLVLN